MTDEQKPIEKKYPKVVAGIYVFNNKGEVLLVRAPHWNNHFVAPGGRVEYREVTKEAAIRETKEETGLDIKDLELIKVLELTNPVNYGKNQTHLICFEYRARLVDENQPVVLDPVEGVEYIWIKPEVAIKREDIEPTIIEVLEVLIDKKEKKSFFGKDECKKCIEAKKECDEYKTGWQRALADYKNLQAETSKRRGEWAQMSEVQILEEFIPVYENFKKAFAAHPVLSADNEEHKQMKNWTDGIGYIMKQFGDVLRAHNIEEIKTVGEKFDPKFHEAVGEEVVEGKEVGEIVKEIAGGYKAGDKVIRAARVIIVK